MPKEYKATATIAPMQFSIVNPSFNLLTGNAVKRRLAIPTLYSESEISACNVEPDDGYHVLSKLVAVEIPKDSSLFSISVNRSTHEGAINCLSAIFDMLQTQQEDFKKPFIELMEEELVELNHRLKDVQSILVGFQQNDIFTTTYFDKRIEQKELENRIYKREKDIEFAKRSSIELVAPIYTPSKSTGMSLTLMLVLGLFFGFLFGIFVAMFREFISKVKQEL
jgi:hypothetical protein